MYIGVIAPSFSSRDDGRTDASLARELNQPLSVIMNNARAASRLVTSKKPDLGEIRTALNDIIEDDARVLDCRAQGSMFQRSEVKMLGSGHQKAAAGRQPHRERRRRRKAFRGRWRSPILCHRRGAQVDRHGHGAHYCPFDRREPRRSAVGDAEPRRRCDVSIRIARRSKSRPLNPENRDHDARPEPVTRRSEDPHQRSHRAACDCAQARKLRRSIEYRSKSEIIPQANQWR